MVAGSPVPMRARASGWRSRQGRFEALARAGARPRGLMGSFPRSIACTLGVPGVPRGPYPFRQLRLPRAPRRAARRARDAGRGALRGRPHGHALQAPPVRRGARPARGRQGRALRRPEDGQQQLIDRLFERNVIGATQRTLFHDLRRVGNAAVHEGKGDHREALHQLRMARELAVWFQRTYGNNRKFDPGPFIPPPEPRKAEAGLHEELQRLRDDVELARKELEAAQRPSRRRSRRGGRGRRESSPLSSSPRRPARNSASGRRSRTRRSRPTARRPRRRRRGAPRSRSRTGSSWRSWPRCRPRPRRCPRGQSRRPSSNRRRRARPSSSTRRRRASSSTGSSRAGAGRSTPSCSRSSAACARRAGRTSPSPSGPRGRRQGGLGRLRPVRRAAGRRRRRGQAPAQGRDGGPAAGEAVLTGYVVQRRRGAAGGQPVGHAQGPVPLRDERPPVPAPAADQERHLVPRRAPPGEPSRPARGLVHARGARRPAEAGRRRRHAKLKVEPMPYIDRDYQRNAILAVEKGLEEGKRELLVAMATGHGQDPHVHRPLLPAAQDQALPTRAVPRRPQRARPADGGRVQGSAPREPADLHGHLQRQGAGGPQARPRDQAPNRHHPGDGQARARSASATAARPTSRRSTSTTASSSTSATAATSSTASCPTASSCSATRTTTSRSTGACSTTSTR